MKRILLLAVLIPLFSVVGGSQTTGTFFQETITITSGTPINITTKAVTVQRLMFELVSGSSGKIQVCRVAVGSTPSANCGGANQWAGEMCFSGCAGAVYSDTSPYPTGGFAVDPRIYWLDGSNSGDRVLVTWWQR